MFKKYNELDIEIQKAKSVVFGLAAGDALGRPAEFLSRRQILDKYGDEGIRDLPKEGLYTDDTQLSIALSEALIASGDKNAETFMDAFTKEFIQWYRSPDNNRAPGQTCLKAAGRMEEGLHWKKTGVAHSNGCGSAMRSSPIGYFFEYDPEKLKEISYCAGICTHGHPAAQAAATGQAFLVSTALKKTDPLEMTEKLMAFTHDISPEFNSTLLKMAATLSWGNEADALEHIGSGWIGDEAVAMGLYCFLKHYDDYEAAVCLGANISGDSDSVASMAGAVTAAYIGVDAVPVRWVKHIENSQYLDDLARRLAQKKYETYLV